MRAGCQALIFFGPYPVLIFPHTWDKQLGLGLGSRSDPWLTVTVRFTVRFYDLTGEVSGSASS